MDVVTALSHPTVGLYAYVSRYVVNMASVNEQLPANYSVTVHGFPVPSSPCLVCVRVRMCEQVSVGVCD